MSVCVIYVLVHENLCMSCYPKQNREHVEDDEVGKFSESGLPKVELIPTLVGRFRTPLEPRNSHMSAKPCIVCCVELGTYVYMLSEFMFEVESSTGSRTYWCNMTAPLLQTSHDESNQAQTLWDRQFSECWIA